MCEPPFISLRHCTLVPSFDGGMRIKLSTKSWSIKTKRRKKKSRGRRLGWPRAYLGGPPAGGRCVWRALKGQGSAGRSKGKGRTAEAEKDEVKGRPPGSGDPRRGELGGAEK